jgi:hypothetical protein
MHFVNPPKGAINVCILFGWHHGCSSNMGTRVAKVLEALDTPKRSDNEMKNHIQKMG